MDSTEIPVYGVQEQSAYNGHFESTCYLLFNREGDCLAAMLRPGNVHSANDWEEERSKDREVSGKYPGTGAPGSRCLGRGTAQCLGYQNDAIRQTFCRAKGE